MVVKSDAAAESAAGTAVEGRIESRCVELNLKFREPCSGGEAAIAAGQSGADAAQAKAVAGEDEW